MSENIRNLVNAAVAGDRNAINEILKRYTSEMYFVTRLYVNNREDARNAEQFALRSAIRRLAESNDADNFEDWLSEIVRDEALHQVVPVDTRTLRNLPYTTDDEKADNSAEYTYNMEECRIRILHVLDKLPEAERAVAALYLYDGMSIADVAQKLYLSEREVESLLTSAKTKINQTDIPLSSFLALVQRLKPAAEVTEILPIAGVSKEEDNQFSMTKEVENEIESFEEDRPQEIKDAINEGTVEEVVDYVEEPKEEVVPTPILADEKIDFPKEVEVETPIVEKVKEMPAVDEEDYTKESVIEESTPIVEEKNDAIVKTELPEAEPVVVEKETLPIAEPVEIEKPEVKEEVVPTTNRSFQEEKVEVENVKPIKEEPTRVAKPKRKVNPLRFLLVLLLALLLIFGGYYLFFSKDKKPAAPASNQETTTETNTTTEETSGTENSTTGENTTNSETNTNTNSEEPQKDTDGKPIGTLEVLADDGINVRTGPSTDNDVVEAVEDGRKLDVYEISEDGTYTWYRIGEDKWIADGGGWVDYKKN